MKTIDSIAFAALLLLACSADAQVTNVIRSSQLPTTNRVLSADRVLMLLPALGTNGSQTVEIHYFLNSLRQLPEWPTIVQGTNAVVYTNGLGQVVINATATGGGSGGGSSSWSFDSDGPSVPGFDSQ